MTTFSPYFSPQLISAYGYVASGTALNEILLTNITNELTVVSGAVSGLGPFSGDASVSGLKVSMLSYSGALSGMYQHALDLFSNLNQKLGIYCTQSAILYSTSAITSGQIVTLTSGWFGTIMGFGQNVLNSGTTLLNVVSAATASGLTALQAIASATTSGFNTLSGTATGLTTTENAAYSGGFNTGMFLGQAAGFVTAWHNPGGMAVLSGVGTSGFINGLG